MSKMKVVVVGGHTRNIGKTSVAAGLIRDLRPLNWTAVKITQYGHGICSEDGEPCGCAPSEHACVLTEEDNPDGRGDTCRFLAAGAARALWLRVREGQLAEALSLLKDALVSDRFVLIESNSILGFLRPALYLFVLDSSYRDFKTSARQFLRRADALVAVESRVEKRAWPDLDPHGLENKPMFPVPARNYSTRELCRFVREKLGVPDTKER